MVQAEFLWLGVGIGLILAEVIVPGGIVILLGLACLIVAAALALGLVVGVAPSFTLWFMVSIVLLLGFRQVTQKLIGGDKHIDNTDEDLDIYNQTAVVIAAIGPGESQGRIEFQGSQWPALGDGTVIAVGANVRIICRENIALVVEPLAPEQAD
ncbi:MAG: NfeD family protein [Shewanella sp.]